ncbi:hypothetical protein V5799_003109 [Amblyomma americanum]|uniref:Nucleolar and spindle-associated protein 1 n=1 Tax=Amblyomma americanum TaxID=6943 RepID=A0AAQ4D9X5_AMBAM
MDITSNIDDLESQKYAELLALARELGYTCKGNPKKAKVVKFIRQSVAVGPVHGKENKVTFASEAHDVSGPDLEETPPAAASASPKNAQPKTPGVKSSSKVKKTPNFSKLHAAEFAKMKSLTECAARRNILANGTGASGASQTPKATTSRIPRLMLKKAKTEPLKMPVRERIAPNHRASARQHQARTILGKVRSNRRFDLLMAKRGLTCD